MAGLLGRNVMTKAEPANGLELCRAAWRARLLFYDLGDRRQVRVPPAAEAASALVSG